MSPNHVGYHGVPSTAGSAKIISSKPTRKSTHGITLKPWRERLRNKKRSSQFSKPFPARFMLPWRNAWLHLNSYAANTMSTLYARRSMLPAEPITITFCETNETTSGTGSEKKNTAFWFTTSSTSLTRSLGQRKSTPFYNSVVIRSQDNMLRGSCRSLGCRVFGITPKPHTHHCTGNRTISSSNAFMQMLRIKSGSAMLPASNTRMTGSISVPSWISIPVWLLAGILASPTVLSYWGLHSVKPVPHEIQDLGWSFIPTEEHPTAPKRLYPSWMNTPWFSHCPDLVSLTTMQ